MVDFELRPSVSLIGQSIEIGEVVLECNEPAGILSIAPFKGQGMAVSDALGATINISLPTVGGVITKKNIRVMWAGQGQWFVVGEVELANIAEALEAKAAVTDQRDAWAVFRLSGPTRPRSCPAFVRWIYPPYCRGKQRGPSSHIWLRASHRFRMVSKSW